MKNLLNDPATSSAVASGWLSAKPWFLGVMAGVLTSSLAEGATDNAGYLDGIHHHWVIWAASSLATMVVGGGARTVQKFQAIKSGVVDQAIQQKAATSSIPVDPSTAPPPGP